MQLTRYTDYGLRTLIYLALLPEDGRASIDEISDIYEISRNNLNKIVHQLGKEQIIETKRGKGGGFRLKKPPQNINLGEVIRLLENNLQVVECHSPKCRILPACKLKNVLQLATQAFMDTLSDYTLADLIEDRQPSLIQILQLN